MIIAACDKPEAKPPTNIEKDEKADTDTDSEGESSGGNAGEMDADGAKSGEGGEEAPSPAHSFAFDTASHKVAFTSGGTYTKAVVETNKPADDTRNIEYTSSENAIATVNGAGVVTFVTQGTVTITATKAAISGLLKATASYILTIDPPNFAFGEATVGSHKVAFTAGTYTKAVDNTNKPAGDARNIEYTSSETKIATVDDAGVVTFIKTGTVTITATKAAQGDHARATASYELTITKMKPANKQALVDEITRAMDAHGNEVDLNYIDVSDITDMSYLFSSHAKGYGRQAFNGDISEWDVSKVTDMKYMFSGATLFNQDISEWDVSGVQSMILMFKDATVFSQNIDVWGQRINNVIKTFSWSGVALMFDGSGLANKLPSWCASVTACKTRQ